MFMDENKFINKLLEHDNHFVGLRQEISDLRKENLAGQDEMITILRRLDQERIFTTEWIKRIEGDVEKHRLEIDKIKNILKIS